MYGRGGLDRFKKAQSSEPFSVSTKSAAQPASKEPTLVPSSSVNQGYGSYQQNQGLQSQNPIKNVAQASVPNQHVTPVGGGQSGWQPPDWAIEPRHGVYYLDVVKDGEVLDKVNLDQRRHIFGRQFHTCDFVLDHQSVSRQHAAVVPHKNGSVYVIDLGSVHGTFVANERLTKDSPVEIEVGQSLRFAASTRTYILRKNEAALLPPPPSNIDLPPPPDPSDEEAVLAYNTYVNRILNGVRRPEKLSKSNGRLENKEDNQPTERAQKRIRRTKVAFKDQFGGELIEVVGYSDGADVETEPGPIGVKEGSLVGKYESLVQITVIPKGQEQSSVKETVASKSGITDKLKEVLEKVKAPPKIAGGIYDDLYGGSLSANVGSSWAYSKGSEASPSVNGGNDSKDKTDKSATTSADNDDDSDDLFG